MLIAIAALWLCTRHRQRARAPRAAAARATAYPVYRVARPRYEHVLVRGKSVLNESGDRAPRGRARDGLAAGKKLETKPTSKRSLPNMSSWVRGDREWV